MGWWKGPGRAVLWVAVCWPVAAGRAAEPPAPTSADLEFFEKKVRPVLADHCYACHSTKAKKVKGGLLLDSRAALRKGGESGPVLVPGQPDRSRVIDAVRYQNVELRMPPKGKLPDAAIADLTEWVKRGASWPKEDAPRAAAPARDKFDLHQRKSAHWAWQPLHPSSPPAVRNPHWPQHAVDRFLLAKLEAKGLTPAPPADRRTLIRRLSFDLIGLPPTPAEVDAFLNDSAPDAVEKVVDRLLASPHFGERWARHWLDLVRYAESRGHEFDYTAPNAYQYRDYVIRAFNADVPYNQLVTEHVAGDLQEQPRRHPTADFNESILATGFWFLGESVHSPVDVRQDEADRFDNMIDVFSKTFLGLTVACARCHDHKFDAISTRDYYALYGFLESSSYRLARFDSMENNRRIARELWQLRERSRPPVQRAVADALRPTVHRVSEYLLAAREGMQAGGGVEAVAQARKLDAVVLGRWVGALKAALKDPGDPLHPWARIAADAGTKDSRQLAAFRHALQEHWRHQDAAAVRALTGAEIVIDYGKARAEDWLPDGVVYGPGPVRPGEIRFGSDPARPIAQVFTQAAATKDPVWDRLTLAPGVENDPGPIGKVVRSGRTLRTPSFRLTAGRLHYRIKGSARIYVSIGNHVLINGPLHGQLLQDAQAGDRYHWVSSPDLSAYKGQLVHVEFTPSDGTDLAIALVVQSAQTPGELDLPNPLLAALFAGSTAASLEGLATGYQQLLADVVERLGADRIVGSPDAVAYARLADWLVQRADLFVSGDRTTGRRLAEATAPWLAKHANLAAQIKTESRLAMAILDGTGANEHVFIRGSPKAPGELILRRFLEALAGPDPLAVTRGSGRLELARQMTDPAVNLFLPRVMVNRVWHHLFGRGIVASVDNFGVMGEAPTHPEMLDYLADQFIEQGWSIKRLMRTLVLSNAYQMSSMPQEPGDQADPQNLLLHRMRLRRLEGEAIRDAMLTVSGRLDCRLYGPSVYVFLTPFMEGRGKPPSGPLDGDGRRSIYLAVRRNFLSPLLLAFDTPIPFSTVGRRTVSNVPAQALILLNDPFVHQQADQWARRVLGEHTSPRDRLVSMYRSAFARMPTEAEVAACLDFLNRQTLLYQGKADDPAVWTDLAHMLFNVKEFIYLP